MSAATLPTPPTDDELGGDEALIAAVERWREAVRSVYLLVKGDRSGEIRGRRPRLLDDRGLHPLSYEWGRCEQLWTERVLPAIDDLAPDEEAAAITAEALYVPLATIRDVARAEAEAEFERAVGDEEVDPWR